MTDYQPTNIKWRNAYTGDPVCLDLDTNKWWFSNEVWSDLYGPYDSEGECDDLLNKYIETLE